MKRFSAEEVADLAKSFFSDHPYMHLFDAYLDITADALVTETLEGDREASASDAYRPRDIMTTGLVGNELRFLSIRASQDGSRLVDRDLSDVVDGLPGMAVYDPQLVFSLHGQGPRTIAAISGGVGADGETVIQLHHHPAIDRQQAVSLLKAELDDWRKKRQDEHGSSA